MKPDEVESQLSAMFDGELPAAECELLSRRIDRDEKLRARWTRYVLIGASMRYEPVATASVEFASRVSAALVALDREVVGSKEAASHPGWRVPRWAHLLRAPKLVWQPALAAALVVVVAGLSIAMLRDATLNSTTPVLSAGSSAASLRPVMQLAPTAQRSFGSIESVAASAPALGPTDPAAWSYVTPSGNERSGGPLLLRSELADYIVAHSDYSTPLMRPHLLSALVSGEARTDDVSDADQASVAGAAGSRGMTSPTADTGETDAATAAAPAHR